MFRSLLGGGETHAPSLVLDRVEPGRGAVQRRLRASPGAGQAGRRADQAGRGRLTSGIAGRGRLAGCLTSGFAGCLAGGFAGRLAIAFAQPGGRGARASLGIPTDHLGLAAVAAGRVRPPAAAGGHAVFARLVDNRMTMKTFQRPIDSSIGR
jgi:hypothetical protein